jgi:uncharacterized protein YlaI
MVTGTWKPAPTGYLCPECQEAVAIAAKNLSDEIDRRAFEHVMKESQWLN